MAASGRFSARQQPSTGDTGQWLRSASGFAQTEAGFEQSWGSEQATRRSIKQTTSVERREWNGALACGRLRSAVGSTVNGQRGRRE